MEEGEEEMVECPFGNICPDIYQGPSVAPGGLADVFTPPIFSLYSPTLLPLLLTPRILSVGLVLTRMREELLWYLL